MHRTITITTAFPCQNGLFQGTNKTGEFRSSTGMVAQNNTASNALIHIHGVDALVPSRTVVNFTLLLTGSIVLRKRKKKRFSVYLFHFLAQTVSYFPQCT